MAFECRRWTFAARLAIRGLICGCLSAVGVVLAIDGRPVLGGITWVIAALVAFDLVRVATAAERAMRDLVDQLGSGAEDLPARLPPVFRDLETSIARAIHTTRDRNISCSVQLEADAALLDTVPAALFVVAEDGVLERTNRAARSLTPSAPRRFAEYPAFHPEDAEALLASRPNSGRIVRLTDGRAAHASVALFNIPDGTQRRLIAVQVVSEALGAVETDAWHRLSRVLAHEMMNSLSPVISLAESLVSLAEHPGSDPDGTETAAAAATIARRAIHLMRFVERYRQLLAVPQPELSNVPLKAFSEDLAALVRAIDAGVKVRTVVDPPDLVAPIDRELIEQALLNLLKNAVEAVGGREHPTVTLRCHAEGGEVEFVVEDNGFGLPQLTDDLFLPFFTTKPNGAGIGLAIARQIAVAHNGSLLAAPREQGATFTLRLPTSDTANLTNGRFEDQQCEV